MKKINKKIARNSVLALSILILFTGACTYPGKPDETAMKDISASVEVLQEEKRDYPLLSEMNLLQETADNQAGALQDQGCRMMVRAGGGGLVGSGVILQMDQEEILIATAAHVLDQAGDRAVVEFWDGFRVSVPDYELAKGTDLAVLHVPRQSLVEKTGDPEEKEKDHGEAYCRAVVSKAVYDRTAVGDTVIAMGSRSGVGEDAYTGVLTEDYVYAEDFGSYMMIARVPVSPGMSGGGLFDEQGYLLGILCGVSEEEDVAVAPLLSLLAMLEDDVQE